MTPVIHPPSNVRECRNWHIQYVCDHMRADEVDQYRAVSGAVDYRPDDAAAVFIAMPGHKFTVIGADGLPAACGGYQEVMPGVWQSWMVGTEPGWKTNWRAITKACRWVMEGLFAMDARRLQTNSLASRTQAIEWYERGLGLVREGTWREFGAQGQDFACFSRVRADESRGARAVAP
jgi:hypothetical protein